MALSIIKKLSGCVCLLLTSTTSAFPLKIAEGRILRDSEVEAALEAFLEPALKKLGGKKDVSLHLVCSNAVNAFATGERSIYFTTGILSYCNNLEELLSVLLHELGHIEGHHIIRQIENLQRSSYASWAPILLGLLAAGLTGSAEPLGLGLSLSTMWQQSSFTGFSRGQESMADQFALKMLKELGWPVTGFRAFMQRMSKKESSFISQIPLYLLTHPSSQERMQAAIHYMQKLESKDTGLPEHFYTMFDRIKIKTIAFFSPLQQALHHVNHATVPEPVKKYGRAIVYYRLGKTQKALEHLASFSEKTDDVFVQELKSQILFESKRLQEALIAANHALKKRPWDPLLCSNKAQILIEMDHPKDRPEAIRTLERALFAAKTEPQLWYWLGVAYGREKNIGRMRVCFCEHALATHDMPQAEFHLSNALKTLRKTDRYYYRAQEIASEIKQLKTQH